MTTALAILYDMLFPAHFSRGLSLSLPRGYRLMAPSKFDKNWLNVVIGATVGPTELLQYGMLLRIDTVDRSQ